MTKITRTYSAGCNGKGNSMNTRMKALLATAAFMFIAWHSAAHAEMSLYYIHNDHLGTPQVVTNEDQNVVWQADYQPFGEVDVTVNTLDQEARFPGQYTDNATGLHYNYFRDYDQSIGRYIQSDPLGLYDGPNTYTYVHGNPVNNIDPLGLDTLRVRIITQAGLGRKNQLETLVDVVTPDLSDLLQFHIDRLGSTADSILSKECKASVRSEFPGEFKDKTLEEIFRSNSKEAKKAKKLLQQSRFKKDSFLKKFNRFLK